MPFYLVLTLSRFHAWTLQAHILQDVSEECFIIIIIIIIYLVLFYIDTMLFTI